MDKSQNNEIELESILYDMVPLIYNVWKHADQHLFIFFIANYHIEIL